MSYCNHCGGRLSEGDRFCPGCGAPVTTGNTAASDTQNPYGQQAPFGQPTYGGYPPYPPQQAAPRESELATAAKVFMILSCIFGAMFYLIPLAWMIPMTVTLFGKLKRGEPIGVGFKICTLLFVNLIAGILLLCMPEENRPAAPGQMPPQSY